MMRWLVSVLALGVVTSSIAIGQMHDHAMSSSGNGPFNPFVVSDLHGGFDVAYVERKDGVSNIMFQRSTAANGFTSAVRVNQRAGDGAVRNENPPKIAVGPGNEVYVVWASERERWKGNIRFARSADGGKTFGPATDLNSDASQPPVSRAFQSLVVDQKGRIYVAWIDERNKKEDDRGAEIWMATSDDHGRTFTHDRKILSGVCECCRTTMVVDSVGRVYVSYRLVPPTGPMARDIAVARSDDGGKTFKPAIVHHDGWVLNACPVDGATMTIDPSDRIHAVWFTQNGDLPRLYFASSADHGLTFSRPEIFDSSQKLAKHAHAVSVGGDKILIAWDDVNGVSVVKWGIFDPGRHTMRMLGSGSNESYPIVATSRNRISLVAIRPDGSGIIRSIQALAQ